jgi:hypothetical protein
MKLDVPEKRTFPADGRRPRPGTSIACPKGDGVDDMPTWCAANHRLDVVARRAMPPPVNRDSEFLAFLCKKTTGGMAVHAESRAGNSLTLAAKGPKLQIRHFTTLFKVTRILL